MIKKQLSRYLEALTKDDQKHFRLYLESPFFKIKYRERVILLFDYLLKKIKYWDDGSLFDNTHLEKKLGFPNVRNIKSILLRSIEDYLNLKVFEGSKSLKQKVKIQSAIKYDLAENVSKWIDKELESKFSEESLLDWNTFKFQLLMEKYKSSDIGKLDEFHRNFDAMLRSMDILYCTFKLKCEQIRRILETRFNRKTNNHFIEQILDNDIIKNLDDRYLDIYLNLFRMRFDSDSESGKSIYLETKEMVFENFDSIRGSEREEIFIRLQNYWASRQEIKDENVLKEVLFLYKKGLEYEILIPHNHMNNALFGNISRIAAELGEFDWLRWFIENYKDKLEKKHKQELVQFSYAYCACCEKKYQESISLLNQVNFSDIRLVLHSKALLCRCYFELKEWFVLQNYLETFSRWLRRTEKISDKERIKYQNFIRLVEWSASSKKSSTYHLKAAEILKTNVPFQIWLNSIVKEKV